MGVLPLQKRGEMTTPTSPVDTSFTKVMLSKSPNPAHLAIAECAERLKAEGRRLRVITQVNMLIADVLK